MKLWDFSTKVLVLDTELRKGLEGCRPVGALAAPVRSAGAGAIAEPRKARFLARRAGNALNITINLISGLTCGVIIIWKNWGDEPDR
jgi:hypothetical protein